MQLLKVESVEYTFYSTIENKAYSMLILTVKAAKIYPNFFFIYKDNPVSITYDKASKIIVKNMH